MKEIKRCCKCNKRFDELELKGEFSSAYGVMCNYCYLKLVDDSEKSTTK